MTTFSQKLTDIYYLFDKYTRNLDPIYDTKFKEYLNQQPSVLDFVKTVFTLGFEVRDLPLDEFEDDVENLLTLITKAAINFDIEADPLHKTIYNIGIINCYLYFCLQRDAYITGVAEAKPRVQVNTLNTDTFELVLPETTILEDSPHAINQVKNIKQSVEYLRKALKLASETLEISTGIYTYHLYRIFDYIFSVFEYYKVENNNLPVDLDSFYVFSDQLEDDSPLWLELEKQIKSKYNI